MDKVKIETPDTVLSTTAENENKEELIKSEICLLFLGTFDHESSSQPNADLVQFKENARITEIRIIPLGAEVTLPNGSFQLGATNPAELFLEFYYNDLQNSSKPTFAMLKSFNYSEKNQIQLSCMSKQPEILTDAILIRGHYSTVTLALYGYAVGEDAIKQIEIVLEEVIPSVLEQSISKSPESCEDNNLAISTISIKEEQEETNPVIKVEVAPEFHSPPAPGIVKQHQPVPVRQPLIIDVPQAIPTISTRVNFSPIRISIQQPEPMETERVDVAAKIEAVSSDEEPFDEHVFIGEPKSQDLPPLSLPLLMETEDISDGEISDGMDEIKFQVCSDGNQKTLEKETCVDDKMSPEKYKSSVSSSPEKTVGFRINPVDKQEGVQVLTKTSFSLRGSPPELLSDQEDSLADEFPDPAVEEIISDEEMTDYGDYEYNEWDDVWPQKLSRGFNPFHISYQVQQLRSLKIELYLRKSNTEDKFSASKLLGAISKFSESEFNPLNDDFIESWVEKMEQLLPVLPHALNSIGEEDQEVLKAVSFWVRKGLDLYLAKNQASIPFKMRHIKAGLKLVHCICNYGGFIAEEILKLTFEDNKSLQHKLLDVLMDNQLKTIVSTQSLTLRSLDATLSTRLGFHMFSTTTSDINTSGLQRLISYFIERSSTTRVSYAFRTFLIKVTTMSNIQVMEHIVQAILDDEIEASESPQDMPTCPTLGLEITAQCSAFLEQMSRTVHRVDQALAFIRILPADNVIELPPVGCGHDTKLNFIRLLGETDLMKICAVLLTCKEASELATPICDFIQCLLSWEGGLVYLSSEAEFTTLVIKGLLRLDEKRTVALEFAHCLEVMRCIDVLRYELDRNTLNDTDADIQCLQQIYSFLATPIGREALIGTLSIGDLIVPLLQCIRDADPRVVLNTEKLSRLVKSARKGYALDLLVFVVKFTDRFEFLRDHGTEIYELIISLSDHYEGYDKLSELLPFLKPTIEKLHFSYEGIESVCLLIKGKLGDFLQMPNSQEQNWGFSPEIITALRILCHFGTSSSEDDVTTILQRTDDVQTSKELKFMMSYVRMNNEDLLSDFMTILSRVIQSFEHIAAQSYLLVGAKGDALLSLLLPVVRLFRKILTRTIQVRNTEYRDLTPVHILLQVYSLIKSYPESSLSHNKVDEIGVHIINALLAYTIPTMRLGEESEEELTKSVWTAMINEIIKFTWTRPANFDSGVTMLSELLPFPFPIQTNVKLTSTESALWVRLKRLWSAYLHGASSEIQELIGILCESAHPELLSTLKQLCLKLADLSASSCLLVCRAVMAQIIASIEIDFEKNFPQRTCESANTSSFVKAWIDTATEDRTLHCSTRTARLLDFLASLISSHGVFKAGVTHVHRALAKMDEKFTDFVSMLCSILTSWSSKDVFAHAQGQRHVVTIFQALCDVEFNLFLSGSDLGHLENQPIPNYIRQNSLPQKETLIQICSAFLTYLNSFDLNMTALKACVAENVLHALQIISETEYGFYHLRTSLDKNTESLSNFTKKLARHLQDENAISSMVEIVTAYVNFLNCLITSKEDTDNFLAIRQNILSTSELWKCLSWSPVNQNLENKKMEQSEEVPLNDFEINIDMKRTGTIDAEVEKSSINKEVRSHPLLQLKTELDKWISRIDENHETYQIYATLEGSLEALNKLLDLMDQPAKVNYVIPTEILLPTPDPLGEVFTRRPVFVLLEERTPLTSCYLTSFPTTFYEEMEPCPDSELIRCDLIEMARTEMPMLDLVKELEGFFKRTLPSNLSELRNPIEMMDLKLKSGVEFPYQHGEGGLNTGLLGLSQRKSHFKSGMRGNSSRIGFGRGMPPGAGRAGPHLFDPFRSRPPNTSRPPSLHVDDFVALESSALGPGGQSNFNKPGPRTGTGRGQRGAPLGRPFSNMDRGRPYRSPQSGPSYYQRNDGNPMNLPRGRGGRGRGYGGGGRWNNSDSHAQNQSFGSGRPDNGRNYEDKFRGGPMRMASRQPFSRNPYRDSPSSSRVPSSNNPSLSTSSALRWRDRQRPFNR